MNTLPATKQNTDDPWMSRDMVGYCHQVVYLDVARISLLSTSLVTCSSRIRGSLQTEMIKIHKNITSSKKMKCDMHTAAETKMIIRC